MTNRFVMSCQDSDAVFEKKVASWLDERDIKWWHRLPSTWLLVAPEKIGLREVRDGIYDIKPLSEVLVVKVEGFTTFAASLRNHEETLEWMRTYWNKKR